MRRNWLGLAVLALPCALYSMDLTVLNLAVPQIAADLHPSSNQLLWIVDIYGFVLAGSLITMGTLGDRIGRRKLLLVGAAAFGIVSALASFATSAGMLIAMRAVLGLAGATIAPSTLSLIHAMFRDERQRLVAIGIWTAAFSAGGLLGPLVGGVVLAHASWRAVFWIGVPVMMLLLALGRIFLPEVRADQPSKFELPSAVMSMLAILLAIYGIKATSHGDLGAPFVIAGVAIGAMFVRRQRRLANPLLDLSLFRAPALAAAIAMYMLVVLVVFGFFTLAAQELQLAIGLSPLVAGIYLIPSSAGFLVGSVITPKLKAAPATILSIGLVIGAIGLVSVVAIGGIAGIAIGTLILSLGVSPVSTLANSIVLAATTEDRAGAAAAVSETGAELGGALGIALLGSLVAAIYRAQPGAVGDSLATSDLSAPARAAFEHGYTIATFVGAVVLLGTAGIVLRFVRTRSMIASPCPTTPSTSSTESHSRAFTC
ncbi:MAG: MFS transporter [Kofleriaceae bacterium]